MLSIAYVHSHSPVVMSSSKDNLLILGSAAVLLEKRTQIGKMSIEKQRHSNARTLRYLTKVT